MAATRGRRSRRDALSAHGGERLLAGAARTTASTRCRSAGSHELSPRRVARARGRPPWTPGHPVREARRGSAGTRSRTSALAPEVRGAILVSHLLGGPSTSSHVGPLADPTPGSKIVHTGKASAASLTVLTTIPDVKVINSVVACGTITLRYSVVEIRLRTGQRTPATPGRG